MLQDEKIANIKQQCKDGFPLEDGPFVMELDWTLARLNVQRQAYYAGSFIGNRAHQCLQVLKKLLNIKHENYFVL